jgi:hypothetical protein
MIGATMSDYVPCPKCSGTAARKVDFTWAGGVLGPALLHHVKCPDCGTEYNGKTGESNTAGMILYSAVFGFILLALVLLINLLPA